MNAIEIINALRNPKLHKWFNDNTDGLIVGKNGKFNRENAITEEIAKYINNTNVNTQKRKYGRGIIDIIDTKTNDIVEAAHNGTFQNYKKSLNHISEDFAKRKAQGYSKSHFALIYLMDVVQLDKVTNLPKSYLKKVTSKLRAKHIANRVLIENTLKTLPNGIVHHEKIYGLSTKTETTILNYDIYLMELV